MGNYLLNEIVMFGPGSDLTPFSPVTCPSRWQGKLNGICGTDIPAIAAFHTTFERLYPCNTFSHLQALRKTPLDTISATVAQLGIDLYEITGPMYPFHPWELLQSLYIIVH
jgi:hypothetical protein